MRCSMIRRSSRRISTRSSPAARPVECYLRLMFLSFRYRLGYESLCAEVSDSISWRRFCRIGLDGGPAPDDADEADDPVREEAVAGLNEALLAKAAGLSCCARPGTG